MKNLVFFRKNVTNCKNLEFQNLFYSSQKSFLNGDIHLEKNVKSLSLLVLFDYDLIFKNFV